MSGGDVFLNSGQLLSLQSLLALDPPVVQLYLVKLERGVLAHSGLCAWLLLPDGSREGYRLSDAGVFPSAITDSVASR
jgi:hypothetical protein